MDESLDLSCQSCPAPARWAACNLEGPNGDPVVRGHACGRHLHSVLDAMDWVLDCVHVYDLSAPVDTA